MGKMEIEGSRGPQEAGRPGLPGPMGLPGFCQTCGLPWSLSPLTSLLHASADWIHQGAMSIRPRQSPVGILGEGLRPLGGLMHPMPQSRKLAFPGPSIWDPGVLRKEILKHGKEREGRHQMVRPTGHVALEFTVQRGWGGLRSWVLLGCHQNKRVLDHHPSSTGHHVLGQVDRRLAQFLIPFWPPGLLGDCQRAILWPVLCFLPAFLPSEYLNTHLPFLPGVTLSHQP